MATDNRTSEPTEAQVEAAAKVLAPDGVFAEDFGEYSRKRDNYRREDQAEEQRYYMRKARAALVAAAGTAPQVACAVNHADGICPGYPHAAPQAESGSSHRGVEPDTEMGGVVCSECGWHLGGTGTGSDVQGRQHAEAFPVLPSSTVDEERAERAEATLKRVRELADEMGEAIGFDRLTHGSEAEYPVSYFRDKLEEALEPVAVIGTRKKI